MPIRIKLFLILLIISFTPFLVMLLVIPDIWRILLTHTGTPLLLMMFLGVIFVTLSSLFVSIQLSLPLGELREIAVRAQSGELKDRVSINTKDEIGELATAFNSMLDKLQSQKINLEELNSNLSEEVKKQTGELSEKVSLLERTNQVMVGRELKMIELKKQLKEKK